MATQEPDGRYGVVMAKTARNSSGGRVRAAEEVAAFWEGRCADQRKKADLSCRVKRQPDRLDGGRGRTHEHRIAWVHHLVEVEIHKLIASAFGG